MDRRDLVLRNTCEVIGEEKLDALLARDTPPVAYIGYETSGRVHLGHWLSIQKAFDLQQAGFHVKILLADWHTFLNGKGSDTWIRERAQDWQRVFKACGLKTEFVYGHEFQETTAYFRDLLALSQRATIRQSTKAMRMVAKKNTTSYVSQLLYPLMQVLDIQYLEADVVVGGMEQRKIHTLAHDLGIQPVCLHHPLLPALQGSGKMSSSDPDTRIALDALPETIHRRLQKAYCPPHVEDNPILQLAKVSLDRQLLHVQRAASHGGPIVYNTYEDLERDFLSGTLHPQDLKTAVAKSLADALAPVHDRD